MRPSKWLGLLGLALVACSAAPTDDTQGSTSGVTQKAFDRNDVLDDKSLRDATALSTDDVQQFLEKTPWGTTSALADYTEDGKTAAEIITQTAQKYGINPLEILVRAQMEQGLVSKKTASASTIAIALGCGCPETPACSDKYKGFSKQVECAAGTLSRSIDRAASSQGTVSGWARYKKSTSEDGLTIIPKNAATAALYTYTPWVGEAGGGKKGVGGASLHAQVWTRFAEALAYAPTPGNSDDNSGDTVTPVTPSTPTTDAGGSVDVDASDPTDPTDDAGSPPAPAADAGTTPPPAKDAGAAPTEGDGSDDDAILGGGNAPPSSNAPPPRSKPSTSGGASSGGEEEASAADLASGGKTQNGGCSTTGSRGTSDALLVFGAALAAVVGARRRRR
jgi:hypothetical protein